VAPERAVAAAISALGADEVAGALPYLSPAGLSSATRSGLKTLPRRLDELRRAAAKAVGVTAPRLVRFARVDSRVLLAVVGAADRLIGRGRTLLVTVASSYASRASPRVPHSCTRSPEVGVVARSAAPMPGPRRVGRSRPVHPCVAPGSSLCRARFILTR
jgi:hypothetical protein